MKLLILLIFFLAGNLLFASPPELAKDCADCHGENGISTESDIPIIAGASATFIEETFYAYKNDMRPAIESKYRHGDTSRKATDMKKIAEQLTEEQVIEIAQYFASLPFVAAKQEFDPALVNIGEKIHIRKCEKCHENGGSSAEDDAGILAGQWTPYLQNTTKDILEETRDVDKKMKKKIKKLSEKEWQALWQFYASQQGE